jgi:hypothetical protein
MAPAMLLVSSLLAAARKMGRLTCTADPISNEPTGQNQRRLHEILAGLQNRILRIIDVQLLPPLASAPRLRLEYTKTRTFFSVLFIAPVTPLLQCAPNPIAVTIRIESSFICSGT